ncbi:hypothetical protein QVD17_10950 [Tagetes erecta]|uniref:Uncharacterized protein n=1 Tax=Tagetes erecta TaxID=13708 RepID=A0AAD8L3E1_TARER|nr:hypothetical protein QVD17_10950 [Tagetes erecta]
MTEQPDWVTTAMADNDVVADLLLRLRLNRPRPAPPQSWTIHQPRSKPQPLINPPSDTPRTSPSTPLSWTAATSVTGGAASIADVLLNSEQPHHNCSDVSRSKVKGPSETTLSKRPRKKKTLAALREEGIVLMDEQNDLKRKLAVLQANCEKQRKDNERLKKIQLDIQLEPQSQRPKAMIVMSNNHFDVVSERKDKTILPDLNVPFGEDVIVSY